MNTGYSQQIVDPCFADLGPLSKFENSDDIVNLCKCNNHRDAANLIEWDGTKWLGTLEFTIIKRPPPEGCNVRALWIGFNGWTGGGEAFGLRLDKKLEPGKTYTYTFTYSRDGHPNEPIKDFSPIVYTHGKIPDLYTAYKVGRLPTTIDWTTQSITFTATSAQAGHEWLILHAYESSGTILSNCALNNALEGNFLAKDTTLCLDTSLKLQAIVGKNYSYLWNTGSDQSSITVTWPGTYSVTVKNYKCEDSDTITVNYEDCEVRLVMPNIFTPNGDEWNALFTPKEHNYIESGTMSIFNRWGEMVYDGNLFTGWNGKDASSGVYFYTIYFTDRASAMYKRKGTLSLVR